MAIAEANAGQLDSAIARFDYLMTIPSPISAAMLRDAPLPDTIKNDPRFIAILERGDKVF